MMTTVFKSYAAKVIKWFWSKIIHSLSLIVKFDNIKYTIVVLYYKLNDVV